MRFRIRNEIYEGVRAWIEGLSNRKRIHSSIGYLSPIDYELHEAIEMAA
ncbi:hypothetical protein [Corynebacterium auriscanis]